MGAWGLHQPWAAAGLSFAVAVFCKASVGPESVTQDHVRTNMGQVPVSPSHSICTSQSTHSLILCMCLFRDASFCIYYRFLPTQLAAGSAIRQSKQSSLTRVCCGRCMAASCQQLWAPDSPSTLGSLNSGITIKKYGHAGNAADRL